MAVVMLNQVEFL